MRHRFTLSGEHAPAEDLDTGEWVARERDFVSAVVDTVDALIVVVDPRGRVEMFNHACERATGFRYEELVGEPVWERLNAPEDRERVAGLFAELRADRVPPSYESEWMRKDGGRRLIAWSNTVLFGDDGRVAHVVGTGLDITDRRAAEDALRASQQQLRLQGAALEAAANAIVITDVDGKITWVNPAFERLTGYTAAEAIGGDPSVLRSGAHDPKFYTEMWLTILAGEVWHGEVINKRKDGRRYIEEMTITPVRDDDGELSAFIAIKHDITRRKQAEDDLQGALMDATLASQRLERLVEALQRRAREATLLNEMGDLLQSCEDPEEAYRVAARTAAAFFPDTAGAMYTISASKQLLEQVAAWGEPALLEPVFDAHTCWAIRRSRIHAEAGEGPQLCPRAPADPEMACLCVPLIAQGETLGVVHVQHASDAPVDELGEELSSESALLVQTRRQATQVFTERLALALANIRLKRTLREQAIHDPLTGLYNRRFLHDALEREGRRAERAGSPLSVLMIDLDHFKRFNDTHGHLAGDRALVEIADLLGRKVRASDLVCRYGGEEFAVVMPGSDIEDARVRAEQLRGHVRGMRVAFDGQDLGQLSISVGVASRLEECAGADQLLNAADDALYRAKQAGRDSVVLADHGSEES